MTKDEARALLNALETEHGSGVAFALLGAHWLRDQQNDHAEAIRTSVEEDELKCEDCAREAVGSVEEWVHESETELAWWLSELATEDKFRIAAGLN